MYITDGIKLSQLGGRGATQLVLVCILLLQVALSQLKVHESALLKCESMESICWYLKTKLPEEAAHHEQTILKQALQFDLEGKLELFETEYQVMDELNGRFRLPLNTAQDLDMLSDTLRRTNLALVEELAICHGSINTLQQQVIALQQQLLTQQERIERCF